MTTEKITRRVPLGKHQQRLLELIEAGWQLKKGTQGYRMVPPPAQAYPYEVYPIRNAVVRSTERAGLIEYLPDVGWRLTGKQWRYGYYTKVVWRTTL